MAQWVGVGDINCTDPKKLHESATSNLGAFLRRTEIFFFKQPAGSKPLALREDIWPNSSKWVPTPEWGLIQCHELNSSKEMKELYDGIKAISFFFKYNIEFRFSDLFLLYYHFPGDRFTSRYHREIDLKPMTGKYTYIDLDYQINSVFAVSGQKCNPDPAYRRDDCLQAVLFDVRSNCIEYIDDFFRMLII